MYSSFYNKTSKSVQQNHNNFIGWQGSLKQFLKNTENLLNSTSSADIKPACPELKKGTATLVP